jgi:hypothetical protein
MGTGNWTDLTTTEYGVGARLADTLFANFESNDEAAVESVFQLNMGGLATPWATFQATTYATPLFQVRLYVPKNAKTLRITFRVFNDLVAGTGYCLGTLGSADSTEANWTATAETLVTISWSDISAYAGTTTTLSIKGKVSGATTRGNLSSDQIIAARWGRF